MHSMPSSFWQWLSSLDRNDQIPIAIMAMLTLAAVIVIVVTIVSFTVYKVHRNRLTDALKRELIERGTSSDDIVAIVRATPTKGRLDRHGL
jgi:hypothetical protein